MNASHHRQAIVIFGVVIPFALIIALVVGTFVGRGKLAAHHEQKVANLEKYEQAKSEVNQLEAFLSKEDRRDKMSYWNSKLEKDFIQALTENLDRILAKYDDSVLRRTEMGQATGNGSIGGSTDNPHSRIQLTFEGGFKPMQLLLAELETEMPHLVLENLSVRAQPAKAEGEESTLQFSLVYLCWDKPKA